MSSVVFFSLLLRSPRSTLFPYTTLFRSQDREAFARGGCRLVVIGVTRAARDAGRFAGGLLRRDGGTGCRGDRKSTRLNSSHVAISYAVFCLKKKKKKREWYSHIQNSQQT